MIESDADRLALIQAVGEQFDTGKPTRMWAIFDEAYLESDLDRFTVKNRRAEITCRESDVELHGLVKGSPIERVANGSKYSVKELAPDGTGLTVISLGA